MILLLSSPIISTILIVMMTLMTTTEISNELLDIEFISLMIRLDGKMIPFLLPLPLLLILLLLFW